MEVLLHTFYCNFGQADENRSSYRGLRYIEFPLYFRMEREPARYLLKSSNVLLPS